MEKVKIFLGGTCGSSTWREELIPQLDSERIETFNPVVPNWTPECQAVEDFHRETDDICLYVITPEGEGFYSFVEVTDDSNKRPEQTVLCVLESANGKSFEGHTKKCVPNRLPAKFALCYHSRSPSALTKKSTTYAVL